MSMKLTKLIAFSAFLLSLCLVSCESEDKVEDFKVVELDIQGITATLNSFNYTAEIPAGGTTFTTKGVRHKDFAYINLISVKDEINKNTVLDVTRPPFKDDKEFKMDGIFGSFKYLNKNEPYEIEFTISPNTTGHKRNIQILFGAGYTTCSIELVQPAE